MPPQNVAEILIAEMRAVDSTGKTEARSNKPAQIDSRPVVRLPVRWKNEPDLARLFPKKRLLLICEAPALGLTSPKGLADYEAIIKAVRLVGSVS